MKINPECTRDILIALESETNTRRAVRIPYGKSSYLLEKYPREEICYHLNQLNQSGWLLDAHVGGGQTYFVRDIAPTAHAFLANIKEPSNWQKVTQAAQKAGSLALPVLVEIASKIILEKI